jgi:Regulator of ribonuclease activity B
MNAVYPDDDDGDALREIASLGADMSRPMTLEFTIAVPTVEGARALAERIAAIGYLPDLLVDDSDGSVSLYCARSMIATYEGVVTAQEDLNALCKPVGACCDGWITAGNRQDN